MLIRDRIKTCTAAAAILLPFVIAAYTGMKAAPGRADFVFVNQGDVSSLDPAIATGIPEGRILMATSEGLASLHPRTLKPTPACAESWKRTDNGKTVVFELRKSLRWSNGDSLTAEDFLYSWKRFLDPDTASPYAYLLWDVKGAKEHTKGAGTDAGLGLSAPDPFTFVVKLERACPYFESLTAFYPLYPVNRECIASRENASRTGTGCSRIITNGPFKVKERLLKDRIRLVKNPCYWDAENVALNTIDALAVSSPMTALNLYLTGEVDWINKVPPIVLPFVRDRKDFSLSPNLGTNFLRFNTKTPSLHDERVRRAISLAIDKEALVKYVLKGGQVPADSFVPPGIPGYTPPRCKVHDAREARSLLDAAGFPGGAGFPELHILYSADETNRDLTEVISMQLKKNLNIRIHPLAQERKGYFVSQNTLSYQICLCSWLGDYLDVSTFLDVFIGSSGNNRTGWKKPEYDTLLERAAVEMDPVKRASLFAGAEQLLLAEMPIAPLYFRTTANMIKPGWEGYHDNIQDVHPLKHLRRSTR